MSTRTLTFTIITPERTVYDSEVYSITLPTTTGIITLLPQHTNLISLVHSGEVIVKKDNETIILHIHKGILEVKNGKTVVILADSADHIHDLDKEKIETAKARVEKILAEKDNLTEIEFARFEDMLLREIARLKLLEKYK